MVQFLGLIINLGNTIFVVSAYYTSKDNDLADYRERDAIEKGFRTGGVKEIAKLSRARDLKDCDAQYKEISELKAFQFKNGTGYGYIRTGDFYNGFINNYYDFESGKRIYIPQAIVYVAHGNDIYMVVFQVDSIGEQIFSTFRFNEYYR